MKWKSVKSWHPSLCSPVTHRQGTPAAWFQSPQAEERWTRGGPLATPGGLGQCWEAQKSSRGGWWSGLPHDDVMTGEAADRLRRSLGFLLMQQNTDTWKEKASQNPPIRNVTCRFRCLISKFSGIFILQVPIFLQLAILLYWFPGLED